MPCVECKGKDGWHIIGCSIELKLLDAYIEKEKVVRRMCNCSAQGRVIDPTLHQKHCPYRGA